VRKYRLSSPPQSLQRSYVHLDNVALVPASLLPLKSEWQVIANDLPQGDILIVLPRQSKQQRVALSVALQLRTKGRHVRVMDNEVQEATSNCPE